MYLHIGGNIVVSMKKIIGIFDYSFENQRNNLDFLINCKNEKKEVYVDKNLESKSYVITDKEIYYSPIATITLKKRFSKGVDFYFENTKEI